MGRVKLRVRSDIHQVDGPRGAISRDEAEVWRLHLERPINRWRDQTTTLSLSLSLSLEGLALSLTRSGGWPKMSMGF